MPVLVEFKLSVASTACGRVWLCLACLVLIDICTSTTCFSELEDFMLLSLSTQNDDNQVFEVLIYSIQDFLSLLPLSVSPLCCFLSLRFYFCKWTVIVSCLFLLLDKFIE